MDTRARQRGFTLPEMLVAITIFLVVMAGISAVFVSSLRAVRQGYQAIDAYELGRSSLAVVKRDLTSCFTSREHGDYYSFCGTPIGMTFVGLVRSSADSATANIARVTYAIYALPSGQFTSLGDVTGDETGQHFTDAGGEEVNTYSLIRYVEPEVDNLDSFPVDWRLLAQASASGYESSGASVLSAELDEASGQGTGGFLDYLDGNVQLSAVRKQLVAAKQRELWIRMLAGEPELLGDVGVDTIWQLLGEDPLDYVVAENIVSEVEPLLEYKDYASFQPFFQFGRVINNHGDIEWLHFWNSLENAPGLSLPAAYANPDAAGSPMFPRLPEVVLADIRLMYESPYPGAPDFDRRFREQIDVPSAYTRGR